GKTVGNDRLTAEGKVDQVTGKGQAKVGDAKEKVKDVIDKI
ncbi:MAG: CsbD-like, partial [Rhizobacter sp.]|nr:CsbD-like [Rhizobacter sp.]